MQKLLTAAVAAAIALAPASAVAQGRISGHQSYVTGSKPDAEAGKSKVVKRKKPKAARQLAKAPPGKYHVVKIKPTRAVHHKHSHRIAKAPRYAKASYYRYGHHHQHWNGHQHWLLPALVGTAIGLGLFRLWH